MKALVLCGGLPQAALIEELKERGIYTILADMNPEVLARPYADEFYQVSVLDVDAIRQLAVEQKVDFIITVCADQVLLVQAQVSEQLGLPCYIDYNTARAVSSKELMKDIFVKNNIPTSKYVILDTYSREKIKDLQFPVIVKPVDSYSSRGVRKVFKIEDLEHAVNSAIDISRTNTAIVEEFVQGDELTVDVYVEEGEAHVLCISNIDKIPQNDRFVICRTRYPALIDDNIRKKVYDIATRIAKAFNLNNSPMLIQMITDGKSLSVVEFCARTGGGDKFRSIKQVSGFDVIKAVVDLTLGDNPHVYPYQLSEYVINEFLYTNPGIFDHLEGFEEMKKKNYIEEYYQLKTKGTKCKDVSSSGDRVAYYTVKANSLEECREKDMEINKNCRVVDINGIDILKHDLIADY